MNIPGLIDMTLPQPSNWDMSLESFQRGLTRCTRAFEKDANRFQATSIRTFCPVWMIMTAVRNNQLPFEDIGAMLAIEWINCHASGDDFINTLRNMNRSMTNTGGFDMNQMVVRRFIINTRRWRYSRSRLFDGSISPYITFSFYLRNVNSEAAFRVDFPYNMIQLRPERYYILRTEDFCYAAYVDHQGTLTFYDPLHGEAKGLRGNFIRTYLIDTFCLWNNDVDAFFEDRYANACERLRRHKMWVGSYTARPRNRVQVLGRRKRRSWE